MKKERKDFIRPLSTIAHILHGQNSFSPRIRFLIHG
jgi:translation elongation factor EF-4